MALHCIQWYCMVFDDRWWYCMVLHGIWWYCQSWCVLICLSLSRSVLVWSLGWFWFLWNGLGWSWMVSDGFRWSRIVDSDYYRVVQNTWTYKWIGQIGRDGMGWISGCSEVWSIWSCKTKCVYAGWVKKLRRHRWWSLWWNWRWCNWPADVIASHLVFSLCSFKSSALDTCSNGTKHLDG